VSGDKIQPIDLKFPTHLNEAKSGSNKGTFRTDHLRF
jgi:hypothetical protein